MCWRYALVSGPAGLRSAAALHLRAAEPSLVHFATPKAPQSIGKPPHQSVLQSNVDSCNASSFFPPLSFFTPRRGAGEAADVGGVRWFEECIWAAAAQPHNTRGTSGAAAAITQPWLLLACRFRACHSGLSSWGHVCPPSPGPLPCPAPPAQGNVVPIEPPLFPLMLSISTALSAVIGAGAVRKNVYNAEKAKGWKIPRSKLRRSLIWLSSSSSHALLIANNGVQHLSGGVLGIWGASSTLQLAHHPRQETRAEKDDEMFRTTPVVVTAQNMSVMLSRLSDNELWDVSLCFTIHIPIWPCCVWVTLALALVRLRLSLASVGIPFANMGALPIWYR
ncbi:uncharacterized protein LOC101752135 [Gallus gallus]|uniref:uncharacterized protein LOC101752135 n=1 Tax=Gallus gallus TaxID=9031 RepID=UPI001AE605D2|nr:uncharacterized protein LOC101752135 [Gallus gallus]